jgi:FixJ family two-component response regulator
MIKATHDGNPSRGILPFMVVLRSDRLCISSLPDAFPFQVLEAECWETAFRKLSSFRPGCLLVDFDQDRDQNIETIRKFADQGIRFSIVGITADRSRRTLQLALRHGFVDLVSRPIESRILTAAVEEAVETDIAGETSLCELRSGLGKLTPKEREVLPHLLRGVPSRRLAGQFLVTYQTIDRHRKRVIEKMNVDNMNELAMKLYRQF